MTDYTQYGEQEHFLRVLGATEPTNAPGRLLEIGAWEPKTFSNSRALIELGWEAVLFEPSPGPLKKLLEQYRDNPRVTVVGMAVSTFPGPGVIRLKVTDDALSADETNAEHFRTWAGYPFYGTLTTVPVPLRLANVCFGPFDFVSIDTEGTSVDLFCEMCSYEEMRPRCVVVEHNNRWPELHTACGLTGYHPLRNPDGSVMNCGGVNVILERGE